MLNEPVAAHAELLALPMRHDPVDQIAELKNDVLRMLILDDSSLDRRRIIRECASSWLNLDISEASSLAALSEALENQKFDIVLIDYRLTDGTGLDALETVYSHPKHLHCATIMITGNADSRVAVDAMKAGCSDYLEKSDISTASLNRAMVNAVQKSRMRLQINSANGMNETLSKVLDKFSADCVVHMKPILSRILRQARTEFKQGTVTDMKASELEKSCQTLWDYLERIEHYSQEIGDH